MLQPEPCEGKFQQAIVESAYDQPIEKGIRGGVGNLFFEKTRDLFFYFIANLNKRIGFFFDLPSLFLSILKKKQAGRMALSSPEK